VQGDGAIEIQVTDIIPAVAVDVVEDVGVGKVAVEGEVTRDVLSHNPINQFFTQDGVVLERRLFRHAPFFLAEAAKLQGVVLARGTNIMVGNSTIAGIRPPATKFNQSMLAIVLPDALRSKLQNYSYNGVANYLIDHYTVVTYDRRGYWGSLLDDPDQPLTIDTHSDDVHHLLAALESEGAYVFGSSIGALIGLNPVIHHPARVRTLVAPEPPVAHLVSDAEHNLRLLEVYRQQGAAAAVMRPKNCTEWNVSLFPVAGTPSVAGRSRRTNDKPVLI